MPHNALTDEQILVLRLASSDAALLRATHSLPADIQVLVAAGYIELVEGSPSITPAGAAVLAGVDQAWDTNARRRVAL